ncbi:MAG: hypothetical protein JWM56_1035 [Candidatus Peribacteria bacterium]|nr:hypothetical protein [Candidatus Peribacteria bacterium]
MKELTFYPPEWVASQEDYHTHFQRFLEKNELSSSGYIVTGIHAETRKEMRLLIRQKNRHKTFGYPADTLEFLESSEELVGHPLEYANESPIQAISVYDRTKLSEITSNEYRITDEIKSLHEAIIAIIHVHNSHA